MVKDTKNYQKKWQKCPKNAKSCEMFKKKLPKHLTFDDLWHFKTVDTSRHLTLSGAGGGGEKHPPSHTFAIPRKKLMGKVAHFFLLFLNMRMEGWGVGTTFCSQIKFSMVGRGLKWLNMHQFHKGWPWAEGRNNHKPNNFLAIFLLKHLSVGEIWVWKPFFGQS